MKSLSLSLLIPLSISSQLARYLHLGANVNARDDRCGHGVLCKVKWDPREILLLCRHGVDPVAATLAGQAHLDVILKKAYVYCYYYSHSLFMSSLSLSLSRFHYF